MSTITTTTYTDDIVPGDIVAVRHGSLGRQEGLVVGSHFDYAGRQVVEVRLDAQPHVIYNTWYPQVTRVQRTVYQRPYAYVDGRTRTVERRIYW